MKRIRRTEQDDLRRFRGGGQMHRRGIDCYDKPRLSDECRQRKQIRLAGKIDDCA